MGQEKDRERLLGLIKPTGGRRAAGVFFDPKKREKEEEKSFILRFVRPIEPSDFNKDGSIKVPVTCFRHKGQLVTAIRIGKTGTMALRDLLNKTPFDPPLTT